MPEVDFALIEDGTSRVLLFWADGSSAIRTLDGAWVSKPRSPSDVVMPDDLGDFRAASIIELLTLAQEATASFGEMPMRAKDA